MFKFIVVVLLAVMAYFVIREANVAQHARDVEQHERDVAAAESAFHMADSLYRKAHKIHQAADGFARIMETSPGTDVAKKAQTSLTDLRRDQLCEPSESTYDCLMSIEHFIALRDAAYDSVKHGLIKGARADSLREEQSEIAAGKARDDAMYKARASAQRAFQRADSLYRKAHKYREAVAGLTWVMETYTGSDAAALAEASLKDLRQDWGCGPSEDTRSCLGRQARQAGRNP